MTINYHLNRFEGYAVEDFDVDAGIVDPNIAYRLRDQAFDGDGPAIEDAVEAFVADPRAKDVEALVIGVWSFESDPSTPVRDALIANADKLPKLKALMFGDVTYEESEISWLEHDPMTPLLDAFPKLEVFRVRGGTGLDFPDLAHERLRTLIIETGGLSGETIASVTQASLPSLEHLELWLGHEYYGWDITGLELMSHLDKANFPALRVLGLRNAQKADDIAKALRNSVVEGLRVLDLSLGTLGDEGARALLSVEALKKLELLDLHHNFVKDEALMSALRELGPKVDLGDSQDEGNYGRYCMVSE